MLGLVLWGHGVDEAGRLLGPTGNGQAFTSGLLRPQGSQRRGTAQELTKGAFGWGSPPKFKKRSKHLGHCKRVWPGQFGAGFSHLCAGNLGMPLCVLVCFVLVISCFLGKFFVKAPSLTWLIQGKKRLVCIWEGKPECSRGRTRGYRAGARRILGSFLDPCSLGSFFSPLPNLLPSPTRQLGSSERKSKCSLSYQGWLLPPGEAACLGG